MAKYYGSIGFVDTVEETPGIWVEKLIAKRQYYGDVISQSRSFKDGDKINDDLRVSNKISILSDPYACQNYYKMKWIEWMGTKWIVSNVDVEYPRLTLSLGGVYNG